VTSRREDALAVVLHGEGRMGRAIAALAAADSGFRVVGALDARDGSKSARERLAESVKLNSTSGDAGAVVIDFSRSGAVEPLVGVLTGTGGPLVSGTTGLTTGELSALKVYSEETSVFYDENMSYGISLLKSLVASARRALGREADVEIIDIHHRDKKDAPSGTALALARAIDPEAKVAIGRKGSGGKQNNEITIHSLRVGGVPGDHRIVFSTEDEVLTLEHRALRREVFAQGALRAARFIASRSSGMYNMTDLVRSRE
jgi:4-hydroxy-tetrahydrodipicolinate reductase